MTDEEKKGLRRAWGQFATGVTVITTRTRSGQRAGLTANSFTSVSLEPPLIQWNLSKTAPSLAAFWESSHFAVNVLAEGQRDLCGHFARGQEDKFEDVETLEGPYGIPLIEGAIAQFECRLYATYDAGDHIIFLGLVEGFRQRAEEPLLFFGGKLGTFAETADAGDARRSVQPARAASGR
jgi:flavin reductase (DIM6/NTAB) family NADH-FMN oxidoreductase RutF